MYLLELQDVIDRVQDDASLLEHPIAELASTPVKRSLLAWAKDVMGVGETSAHQNRRLLTEYLESINPLTDEIRLLRARLLDEIHQIYNPEEGWK